MGQKAERQGLGAVAAEVRRAFEALDALREELAGEGWAARMHACTASVHARMHGCGTQALVHLTSTSLAPSQPACTHGCGPQTRPCPHPARADQLAQLGGKVEGKGAAGGGTGAADLSGFAAAKDVDALAGQMAALLGELEGLRAQVRACAGVGLGAAVRVLRACVCVCVGAGPCSSSARAW